MPHVIKHFSWIVFSILMCQLILTTHVFAGDLENIKEKLLKNTPVISLKNKEINTYEVSGFFTVDSHKVAFKLYGEKPNRESYILYDTKDSTPILIGRGGYILSYDVKRGGLILTKGTIKKIIKAEKKRTLTMEVGLTAFDANESFNNHSNALSEININSIINIFDTPANIEISSDNKNYILNRHSKDYKSLIVALIDKKNNYKALAMYRLKPGIKKTPKPSFAITNITINEPIKKHVHTFPLQKIINSGLLIEETNNFVTDKSVMRRILGSLIFRTGGLNAPHLDQMTKEIMEEYKANYADFKKRDQKISKFLKEALKDEF